MEIKEKINKLDYIKLNIAKETIIKVEKEMDHMREHICQ